MKVIRRTIAQRRKNTDTCWIVEYPLENPDVDGVVVELSGRYPEAGNAINQISRELAYVVSGSGTVTIGGELQEISTGDVVLIEPNEPYVWTGNLSLFMTCSPSWTPAQHKITN